MIAYTYSKNLSSVTFTRRVVDQMIWTIIQKHFGGKNHEKNESKNKNLEGNTLMLRFHTWFETKLLLNSNT